MSGFDTAGPVHRTFQSARREFGQPPRYWIRYFSPSPAADIFADAAVAESAGAWDSGGPYVGCVSSPSQYRLSGSFAEGQADAAKVLLAAGADKSLRNKRREKAADVASSSGHADLAEALR